MTQFAELEFLSNEAPQVARELIGWRLFVREVDGGLTGGVIAETEAYTQEDAASHSYRGKTPRTEVMFGPAGHVYVYFTYGMHWCMNIVTGQEGSGQAVLLRALAPETGIPRMLHRRGAVAETQLANGPAKLCQALGVTGVDNGAVLGRASGRFVLLPPDAAAPVRVQALPRIGIRKDTHRLWRFRALP